MNAGRTARSAEQVEDALARGVDRVVAETGRMAAAILFAAWRPSRSAISVQRACGFLDVAGESR